MAVKKSPYNPQDRKDNCVACVSACLLHRLTRELVDADLLDTRYNITQQLKGTSDKTLVLRKALALMVEATALKPVPNEAGRPYRDAGDHRLPDGDYALFIMGRTASDAVEGQEMITYHVVFGHFERGTWAELYDPQIDAPITRGHLAPPTYAVLFKGPA